jgi:hypothetical protein
MKAFPSGDTNTVLAWGPKLRNDFLPSLMFSEKTAKIDCTPSLLATLLLNGNKSFVFTPQPPFFFYLIGKDTSPTLFFNWILNKSGSWVASL